MTSETTPVGSGGNPSPPEAEASGFNGLWFEIEALPLYVKRLEKQGFETGKWGLRAQGLEGLREILEKLPARSAVFIHIYGDGEFKGCVVAEAARGVEKVKELLFGPHTCEQSEGGEE